MNDLKIGVYAVGRMGKNHARVLGPGTNVYDESVKARKVADGLGYTVHGTVNSFLDSIDAAIIAVPSKYHLEAFETCIKADKHILLEKPMAPTLSEALKIQDMANKREDLTVMINHIERFNPVIQELKKRIGDLEIKKIDTFRYGLGIPESKDILDDGVINDLGVHDIDIIRYIVGLWPYKINANITYNRERSFEEIAHIDTHYLENDMIASINVGWDMPKVRRVDVTTKGEHISADMITQTLTITEPWNEKYKTFEEFIQRSRDATKVIEIPIKQPLETMMEEFRNAVKTGEEPPVTVSDGLYTATIIDAARRSHGRELSF